MHRRPPTYVVPRTLHQLFQAVHPGLPLLQLLSAHRTQRAEQHHHSLTIQCGARFDGLGDERVSSVFS